MSSSGNPPWTPLHAAAEQGNLAGINTALTGGADVNALGYSSEYRAGVSPLWIAADKGHLEAVKLLISKGADLESRKTDSGSTALIVAAYSNWQPVIRALLEAGANIDNARTDTGQTALLMAIDRNHADLSIYLLKAGANPNKSRTGGSSPLQLALEKSGFSGVVAELINRGAELRPRSRDGASLLWCMCERAEVFESALLAALPKFPAADLSSVCGPNGSTPLHEACAMGSATLVKALIAAGADITAERRADRATPMWIACERGEVARPIINALVEAGAKA